MSLKIPISRNKDRAMGTNHVRVGACPYPNLAQKWENGKNYNYMEKFVIRIPKQGLFQDSNSGGVGWIYGGLVVSPKIDFSPLQVGVCEALGAVYATWEYICTDTWHGKASHTPRFDHSLIYPRISDQGGMVYPLERLDEIRSKLGQRLTSMGQVAPPKPTSRTKTGRRRTFDSGNSSTDRR